MGAEHGGEVGLRLKSDTKRHLRQGKSGIPEHVLGALDSAAQDELVRPDAGCGSELGGKMHSAETRGASKIRKPEWVRKIGVDELQNPLVPPLHKAGTLTPLDVDLRALPAQDACKYRGGDALSIKLRARAFEIVTCQQRECEPAYARVGIGTVKGPALR
jgi:hypothetical protein